MVLFMKTAQFQKVGYNKKQIDMRNLFTKFVLKIVHISTYGFGHCNGGGGSGHCY